MTSSVKSAYIALKDDSETEENCVYFTENFDAETPTWTALTNGITYKEITTIKVPFGGQYCYLLQGGYNVNGEGDIWRWNGSAWESMLTDAQAKNLIETEGYSATPGNTRWIAVDDLASSNGRTAYIYAMYYSEIAAGIDDNGLYLLRSTDSGETWSFRGVITNDFPVRDSGNFLVFGDNIIIAVNDEGGEGTIFQSSDGGQNFSDTEYVYGKSTWSPVVIGESASSYYAGGMPDTSNSFNSSDAKIYKLNSLKGASPVSSGWQLEDGMPNFAVDPDDGNTSYCIRNGTLWTTNNDWSSYSTITVGNNIKQVYMFYSDELILAKIDNVSGATPSIIYYSEDGGATLNDKTGALPNVVDGVAFGGFEPVISSFDSVDITYSGDAYACQSKTFTASITPAGAPYNSIEWQDDNLLSGQSTESATYFWSYPGRYYVRVLIEKVSGDYVDAKETVDVLENKSCVHCPDRSFTLNVL